MTAIEEIKPRHRVRIDTLFWAHLSPFRGTQAQLDELKADTEHRAAMRFHAELTKLAADREVSIFDRHRPATRRLRLLIHVGLFPLLWAVTTCACGDRWPCNAVKRQLRCRCGWTVDITDELKAVTRRLPKPATRSRRLYRAIRRVTAAAGSRVVCGRW